MKIPTLNILDIENRRPINMAFFNFIELPQLRGAGQNLFGAATTWQTEKGFMRANYSG